MRYVFINFATSAQRSEQFYKRAILIIALIPRGLIKYASAHSAHVHACLSRYVNLIDVKPTISRLCARRTYMGQGC